MGYYIELVNRDFRIPENEEVLQALKEANTKYDDIKSGGMYGPEGKVQKWFSWMDADYDQTVTSVGDVFKMLGFEIGYDRIDNIDYVSLDAYNSKAGQEDLFLHVVAPYVKNGSFIEWLGEDSARWRYLVLDGKLYQQHAIINWSDPGKISY